MDTNLVEMFRASLNWVTVILDAPSARVVLFGVRIQGYIIVEGLLGFVIVFLLSQKSYKPPQRPLTEQEIDELCPETLIPPITEDMRHEPPVLESAAGPHTTFDGKDVVNFASANYLGLIGHEKLLKYGVGSCGPRGFYGTIDVPLDCETTRISKFLEGVHWGIQNGLQLSRSTIVYFKHNDMDSLRSTVSSMDVIDQNPDLLVKMKQNGMSLASDPESPIVFLKLEKSSGSAKEDLLLLEKMAARVNSLLVVSSKKSFLDKCRLPVGIKLFVSAGHSDTDLIKASDSLKASFS
ncbi:hypothetical protein Bca52824_095057 [Brassica carinata]|uniref:Uncharacterized protein n=1 Tax=Brassica carinata TaxID=52824 RepID=A0A8X7P122_BRACI|nr:hypothetical protein Bca52824_095057 [Brassica carinata]